MHGYRVLANVCLMINLVVTQTDYEVPVILPAYDQADHVIRVPEDWEGVNNPGQRVFIVEPGDYRDVGTVVLTASGSNVAPRYLMLKSIPENQVTHATQLAEAEQAIVSALEIDGGDFWIVDRISIVDTPANISPLLIHNGATDNVLNRMRVEKIAYGSFIRHGCHRNVVQNSLIGGQRQELYDGRWVYLERIALGLSAVGSDEHPVCIEDTRFVNNEIYNMTDSIQLIARPVDDPRYIFPVDYPGTVIAYNELYVTSAMYTDGAGNFTPDGLFAAAENAIDLKAGSSDPNRPVIVTGNRMWGFRYVDEMAAPWCSSRGEAIVVHYRTGNVIMENNTIFDSNWGISGMDWSNAIVRKNVIAGIGQSTGKDNSGYGIQVGAESSGVSNAVIEDNVISGVLANALYVASDEHIVSFSFSNNVVINAGALYVQASRVDAAADYNRYYGTIPAVNLVGPHDEIFATAEESGYHTLCFDVRKWTTPEVKSLAYARPPECEEDNRF